ncbi:MAG: hypothetical protein ACI4OR_00920 [Alphaproteobacteria bacterium]
MPKSFSLEIGRLMALADSQQKQLAEIKKHVADLNSQITSVHTELLNFMASVQNKSTCREIHNQLRQEFVLRREIAPIRSLISAIALTTATAILMALLNLILK